MIRGNAAETSLADIAWILDGITTLEKSLALIEDVKLGRIARARAARAKAEDISC
jgi:hypothetical protein